MWLNGLVIIKIFAEIRILFICVGKPDYGVVIRAHRIEFLTIVFSPRVPSFSIRDVFDNCLCLQHFTSYTCCISSFLWDNNKNLFSEFFLVYQMVVYHFMSHYPKYINSMNDPVTITGNIWIYPTSSHLHKHTRITMHTGLLSSVLTQCQYCNRLSTL